MTQFLSTAQRGFAAAATAIALVPFAATSANAADVDCNKPKPKPVARHSAKAAPAAPQKVCITPEDATTIATAAAIAATASAPRVEAAPAPTPPPPPPPAAPQLQPVVFDATKPVNLPMAQLTAEQQAAVDKGDCSAKWNTPINAHGVEVGARSTMTMTGQMAVVDGKVVFIASGPTSVSQEQSSRSVTCQGWLSPVVGAVGVTGGLYIAKQNLDLQRQSLRATQQYYTDISNAIKDKNFTSLFGNIGTMNCGIASANGSTVSGGMNASCNIGNIAVNSVLGNGGIVNATNNATSILQNYLPTNRADALSVGGPTPN